MYADMLAKAQMDMSPEGAKLLDDLIGGNLGNKTIKQKEAVELLEFIKKGGYTGGEISTDAALDILKGGMGEQQYGKLMGGVLSGADKPIAKQLGGTVAEQTIKQGLKLKAKAGAKSLVKKLPLIGAIAGVAFGIQRALEGDLLGAGLEITSGILGATGVGGGLGLAIDGFLLGRDLGMMPLKKGVVATGSSPVPAVFGEAGKKEAALPLEGSEGIIAGTVFGDAAAEALANNFFAKGSNFVYSGTNNPNEMSSMLNNTSAKTGMGQMLASTTVINNNYAVAKGGSEGESSDSKFPSSFQAFTVPYSLASK